MKKPIRTQLLSWAALFAITYMVTMIQRLWNSTT
jgi:hypothetical protein